MINQSAWCNICKKPVNIYEVFIKPETRKARPEEQAMNWKRTILVFAICLTLLSTHATAGKNEILDAPLQKAIKKAMEHNQ